MTLTRDLVWLLGEAATVAHLVIAGWVTCHALLNKRAVGSAVAWIGIAWLSPFIGGALYYGFGINRVKRRARRLRRTAARVFADEAEPAPEVAIEAMPPLEYAIGRMTGLPAEPGNAIVMLRDGEEAYPAMLAAIEGARMSVGLESYIFRDDVAGEEFIAALIRAAERGVAVRDLLVAGCRVWLQSAPFDHSKLMVVDGRWSLIGSSNWDTRSFRLNFELDVEVQDAEFARRLIAETPGQRRLTIAELDAESLPLKLRNSAARLMQPYL